MEEKKGRKRQKNLAEEKWKCTICTFENRLEAYKCAMCETRKGTSTRKPKVSLSQHFPSTSKTAKSSSSLDKVSRTSTVGNSDSPSLSQDVPTPTEKSFEAEESIQEIEPTPSETNVPSVTTTKRAQNVPKIYKRKLKKPPRHKNIDRSTAVKTKITVNGITVQFIDYQRKKSGSEIKLHSEENGAKIDAISDSENVQNLS
ncbi:DgyrCDS4333 [Dimorphilus gyrociliatus]|uniref:DgyrCDS4333 n=1 Tax=Dimorphilus gyrociliatus TaxID=2664684 RepID=A0A7I8VGQ1_9ANNE|nr:DgyrCDS4333 [Dimorphilus gyrociliatus]